MIKRRTVVLIAALVLLAGTVVRYLWIETHTRRWCGHWQSLSERLSGQTHCCESGAALAYAGTLLVVQSRYRSRHGRYAHTWDELHADKLADQYEYENLISWVETPSGLDVRITKGLHMPGYFLISEGRRTYFNADREATVNDLWLNP